MSYDGSRSVPAYSPFGVDAATIGQYYGTSDVKHDDIQNNFAFRFGHNNNMSLQWLFRSSETDAWGNYGGLANASYYPYNPLSYSSWDFLFPGGLSQYDQEVYLLPGVPATNSKPTSAEETQWQPLAFNKLGYTWNINSSTFMNLNWANFYQQTGNTNYTEGSSQPGLAEVGGQRIFSEMDLTHQFGSNHTTTLALRYEDDLPRWNQQSPWFAMLTQGYIQQGINDSLVGAGLGPNEPSIDDWYLPVNPGQPVNQTTNPCIGAGGAPDPYGCYVYDYMIQHNLWHGTLPRIPTEGLDYNHTIFHESGIGIRDQWAVNPRLNLDYGLRMDSDKLDWGYNPYGGPTVADARANPSDVTPSTKLGSNFLNPSLPGAALCGLVPSRRQRCVPLLVRALGEFLLRTDRRHAVQSLERSLVYGHDALER